MKEKKLLNFYSQTQGLLSTSHYESFNFPVLETLFFGNSVFVLKSAIIPECYKYVNFGKSEKELFELIKRNKKIRLDKKNCFRYKKKF